MLGLVSRQATSRVRGKLLATGRVGKQAFGGLLLLLSVMILSGADKLFEAWILKAAPDWLVNLTTSI
jgi:hypothetical protein